MRITWVKRCSHNEGLSRGRPGCGVCLHPGRFYATTTIRDIDNRKEHGRRATGMTSQDFGKPIIAVANSYTGFVPGHVHLKDMGALVCDAIAEYGGIGREFNTIAVDDGIAMGHSGMLYSLPSREIIADSVEYMVNAHTADALVCISNCDKITPGMLMAALRLNIPTMESGNAVDGIIEHRTDLIDAIALSANDDVSDDQLGLVESNACPTCGSCSGMFTANSMNCLTEALGL